MKPQISGRAESINGDKAFPGSGFSVKGKARRGESSL